jgi:hypothetical protein
VKLTYLAESFYTHIARRDMESVVAQFAFGLGKQIHDDLLPLDEGLVVQVFPDAIEISGSSGEVRLDVGETSISIGDKKVLDISENPSLGEVGQAMVQRRTKQQSAATKGLSDRNLLERIEEEVRKSLGL